VQKNQKKSQQPAEKQNEIAYNYFMVPAMVAEWTWVWISEVPCEQRF
jgi:hypothetical protein